MIIYQGDGYSLATNGDGYRLRNGRIFMDLDAEEVEPVVSAASTVRGASYGMILAATWAYLAR